MSFGDSPLDVLVRGGHDTHVAGIFPPAADRPVAAFLQYTEQVRLHLVRQIAHLVEKQRPAIRRMKYSRLVGDSSRERTFDVTEKFRCGQLFRDGSAIDGHERLIVPCTRAMDQVGNQFFPRTVLSTYQHGHIGYGDQPSTTFHLPNRRAYPLQYV